MLTAYSEESVIEFPQESVVSEIESSKYGKVLVVFLNSYLYAFFSDQPGNMFIPAGRSKLKKSDLKGAIKKIESYIAEDKIDGVFQKVKNQMNTQTFSPAIDKKDITLSLSLLNALPKDEPRGCFVYANNLCVLSGQHLAFSFLEKENTPMFSEETLKKHPYIYTGVIDGKKKFFCEKDTNISSREVDAPVFDFPIDEILFSTSDNLVSSDLIIESVKKASEISVQDGVVNVSIERKKDRLTISADNSHTVISTTIPVPAGENFIRSIPAACIQDSLIEVVVSKNSIKLVHDEGVSFIIHSSYTVPISTGSFEPLEEGDIYASFVYKNAILPEGRGNLIINISDGIAKLKRKRGKEIIEIPLEDGTLIGDRQITVSSDDLPLIFSGNDVTISIQEREGSDIFFSCPNKNVKLAVSEVIFAPTID